jgi:hypothetical protein
MLSRSGLHRDLRPQAAGARHLARPIPRRDMRVKRMKPELAGAASSLGGPESQVVAETCAADLASAARHACPMGAACTPE